VAKKLVIVESPAKGKTIKKYLGRDYSVKASFGHIRDLPKTKLGIDLARDFKPQYVTIKGKGKVLKAMAKEAKEAEEVFLATDMDREGEAIAWHLKQALNLPDQKTRRVIFNEITARAIRRAFSSPGDIDIRKVNAQQARRLLDRIVGYKLSPLLWKKVARGLSAGRVQSVAVRLIVDREREIEAFRPEEYWEIRAKLSPEGKPEEAFLALLQKKNEKPVKIRNEEEAREITRDLEGNPFIVESLDSREKQESPPPPFTTSLLQQAASINLHFSTAKTMRIAQQLYEGLEIGDEGSTGLITYMRTDSFHTADSAVSEARTLLKEKFGQEYLPEKPNYYRSKKSAQGAHEAIRPTSAARTPESVAPYLSKEQESLYRLIWERFLASQMKPALYRLRSAKIRSGPYEFTANERRILFDGYTRLLGKRGEEKFLPELAVGEKLALLELLPSQHFTEPPRRYTEASLVKTLESKGIGRPSTYAPIIQTIEQRGYVRRRKRVFYPTELGKLITDKLVEHFPEVMDVGFTSQMEEELDQIEDGLNWLKVLRGFYERFEPALRRAEEKMKSSKEGNISGFDCPNCGKPLVYRWSKGGRFLGCSGFPVCRTALPIDESGKPIVVNEKCPLCGSPMRLKSSRWGKFLACSNYPRCKGNLPFPVMRCPEEGCGGYLVWRGRGRKRLLRCSRYPECTYTTREKA